MAGIMQAVPDAAGTEVILESTANGMGNLFHQLWQQAETGDGEYVAIFIHWYWTLRNLGLDLNSISAGM